MSLKKTSEETLRFAIEEQRRVYDDTDRNYSQIKARTLAFLGATFAVFAFILADDISLFLSIDDPLERVLMWVSLVLSVIGLIDLFKALQPATWEYPTEQSRFKVMDFATHKDYLIYVLDRYSVAYFNNTAIIEKKHKHLKNAFLPLLISATILLLLKVFKEANV